MYKYITISTDSREFNLSAGLNTHGNFFMPSLTIGDGDSCECFSDNESYLIGRVYAYLCGTIEDEEFDNILKSEKEDLLAVFEEAIGIGFFDEYFEKNN